jgi:hypothetical protein
MHGGHEPNLFLDALLLIIITAYLGIAFQFWTRRRMTSGRATTALAQLVVIFVFCAICGYLPRLVEVPMPLLLAAHLILAASAWTYLFAGQVDRLSVAVDFADSGAQTLRLSADDLDAETEACARLAEQLGSKVTAQMIRQRLASRRNMEAAAPAPTEGSAVTA